MTVQPQEESLSLEFSDIFCSGKRKEAAGEPDAGGDGGRHTHTRGRAAPPNHGPLWGGVSAHAHILGGPHRASPWQAQQGNRLLRTPSGFAKRASTRPGPLRPDKPPLHGPDAPASPGPPSSREKVPSGGPVQPEAPAPALRGTAWGLPRGRGAERPRRPLPGLGRARRAGRGGGRRRRRPARWGCATAGRALWVLGGAMGALPARGSREDGHSHRGAPLSLPPFLPPSAAHLPFCFLTKTINKRPESEAAAPAHSCEVSAHAGKRSPAGPGGAAGEACEDYTPQGGAGAEGGARGGPGGGGGDARKQRALTRRPGGC